MSGHCLCQHCLTRAWRSEHQDSLPGTPDALEKLRHQDGQKHCFLQQLLRRVQVCNILEADLGVFVKDFSFESLYQFVIRTRSFWVAMVKESLGPLFLFFGSQPGPVIVPIFLLFFTSRNWSFPHLGPDFLDIWCHTCSIVRHLRRCSLWFLHVQLLLCAPLFLLGFLSSHVLRCGRIPNVWVFLLWRHVLGVLVLDEDLMVSVLTSEGVSLVLRRLLVLPIEFSVVIVIVPMVLERSGSSESLE